MTVLRDWFAELCTGLGHAEIWHDGGMPKPRWVADTYTADSTSVIESPDASAERVAEGTPCVVTCWGCRVTTWAAVSDLIRQLH